MNDNYLTTLCTRTCLHSSAHRVHLTVSGNGTATLKRQADTRPNDTDLHKKNKKNQRTGKEFFWPNAFGTFGFARHTSQRFAKPKEPSPTKPTHHPTIRIWQIFFWKRKKILHNSKTVSIFADLNTFLVSKYERKKRRNNCSRHNKRC